MADVSPKLQVISAAASRVMDELPTLFLGSIAIIALHMADPDAASLKHDVVLGVVTGLLGYMKSKSSSNAKVSTPDGTTASMSTGPAPIVATPPEEPPAS